MQYPKSNQLKHIHTKLLYIWWDNDGWNVIIDTLSIAFLSLQLFILKPWSKGIPNYSSLLDVIFLKSWELEPKVCPEQNCAKYSIPVCCNCILEFSVGKNISLLVDMFKVHLQQGWNSISLTIAREGSLPHERRPIVMSMSGFWQPMELTNLHPTTQNW